MSEHEGELLIPPAVFTDPRARELARIWAAHGDQHVSMATGLWEDPFAWGIMLVDLAHHVANAYKQQEGRESEEVLARLKEGFEAEWDKRTDVARGNIVH